MKLNPFGSESSEDGSDDEENNGDGPSESIDTAGDGDEVIGNIDTEAAAVEQSDEDLDEGGNDEDGSEDDTEDSGTSFISSLASIIPFAGSSDESVETKDPEELDGIDVTVEFEDLFGDELSNTPGQSGSKKSDSEGTDDDETSTSRETEFLAHVDDPDISKEDYLSRVESLQQRKIAPNEIEKGATTYKVGEKYRRVLFASALPDVTPIGGIKSIVDDPDIHFDMTMHFQANDHDEVVQSAEDLSTTLEASAEVSASQSEDAHNATDKLRRKERVDEYRDQIVENNERPCTFSLYLSARGDSKEEVADSVDVIRDTLKRDAGIELETLERKQHKALVSASPIGLDPVRDSDMHIDPTHNVLGASVGSLLASLGQGRVFEPEGHEWGMHSVQGHPIVKDPFDSPTNYNMICVGESGSGKSVDMKRQALHAKATNEDTLVIISDPLKGFEGLAEALDAKKVTVGGKRPFNPMEIRKPPEEYINSAAFDEMAEDPLKKKIDDVMAFLINFVSQQPGLTIGDESQLLRSMITQAYEDAGITSDVHTHDKESPSLQDVIRQVKEAKKNPEKWTQDLQDPETITRQAEQIGIILREFGPTGNYRHLAQKAEDDPFEGSDVIYLDLSQEESSGGSSVGVMGQLMFSLAYEKCKQYPGPALYIVDEARHLFGEQQTLDYLAQRNRHSRHYDTSIRFITQEMDDFFEHKASEGIVNNSAFEVVHKSKSVDDWGDRFGLNQRHKNFVKNAATGDDMPYSQALVRFPDGDQWYPINIEMGSRELAVVDFDEQEDDYQDLPGKGGVIDRSPIARELQARLREGETSYEETLEEIFEPWERDIWTILGPQDIEQCLHRIENGTNPRRAFYISALEKVKRVIEISGADEDVSLEVVNRLEEALSEQFNRDYVGDVSSDVIGTGNPTMKAESDD